jgi:hypothetical protein
MIVCSKYGKYQGYCQIIWGFKKQDQKVGLGFRVGRGGVFRGRGDYRGSLDSCFKQLSYVCNTIYWSPS